MNTVFRTASLFALASLALAANAGTILGIDANSLYTVDTTTGNASVLTGLGTLGAGGRGANGLAYDPITNTAFYQRDDSLYYYRVGTGTFGGGGLSMVGQQVASGAFYNGAYYYVGNTSTLFRVAVTPFQQGFTFSRSVVTTLNNSGAYGDIAINAQGLLFGSASGNFFSVDLANNNQQTLLSSSSRQTQLAYDGGQLFAVATGGATSDGLNTPTGTFYTVTSTGAFTATGAVARLNGTALALNDTSSFQAVPEPSAFAALSLGAVALLKRRKRA